MADSRVLRSNLPVAAEDEDDALILEKQKRFWDWYGNEVNAA